MGRNLTPSQRAAIALDVKDRLRDESGALQGGEGAEKPEARESRNWINGSRFAAGRRDDADLAELRLSRSARSAPPSLRPCRGDDRPGGYVGDRQAGPRVNYMILRNTNEKGPP
jgi:hypothetical protein